VERQCRESKDGAEVWELRVRVRGGEGAVAERVEVKVQRLGIKGEWAV
jgi:hypothetical protein